MSNTPCEKHVLEIWQNTLQNYTDLVTVENEPIKIIYPGRRNDDRGADFKDAVIATGHGELKGDIEIHVKASSWWAHGHHKDAAYNRVVLHVVYQNDSQKDIILQNGARAPTLSLYPYVRAGNISSPPLPCRNIFSRGNAGFIGKTLDEAGEQRFLAQAALFKEAIAQVGEDQALYQGIMTALGYSKNKPPMEELAGRMPLKMLETAVATKMPNDEYLAHCQSLLMGTAGLLPSQRGLSHPLNGYLDDWEAKLENIWTKNRLPSSMSAADWRFFKVRPSNHPVRRLAAMSYLLLRYRQKGLLAGLEERFEAAEDDEGGRFLEQALIVPPEGYWGRYLDFGVPARGAAPALLGGGRAEDIIINVLLPFAYATWPSKQAEKALNLYRNFSVSEENSLVKHMRSQFGLSKPFSAASLRQQGLIHVYKTLCSQGMCRKCRLNAIGFKAVNFR